MSKKLTKAQALSIFKQEYLPMIRENERQYKLGRTKVDSIARRMAWGD